ncbi:unnamed protein product [Dracunculus medinensis]|uniref:Solute carrier family 12 member 6 n=1 Tax=Dracunculus medinensis TaxID=318479 RepID=A0A158Q3J1_DRAME|nr:unnamed protein product [Dracunculus medinensis]
MSGAGVNTNIDKRNSSLNIWITPDVGNDEPKVEFAEPRNNLIFPVDACVLEKKSSGTKNSKINERNIDYDDSSTVSSIPRNALLHFSGRPSVQLVTAFFDGFHVQTDRANSIKKKTFLTCISLSAVATNGVIESGGTYFMISRNLGAEFGTSVGILFYLANACACAMYIVGAIEVLLLYLFPTIAIGGTDVVKDIGFMGMMSNNIRIYGTVLLLITFFIVALGVKFVQFFAPVSLFCVLFSILSIFAGTIHKSIVNSEHTVCTLNESIVFQSKAFIPDYLNNTAFDNQCPYCTTDNVKLLNNLCGNINAENCTEMANKSLSCIYAFPGIRRNTFNENLMSNYMNEGESAQRVVARKYIDIFQDISTNFFVILAIYFPSVTGIMTGSNMSGDLRDPQKNIPVGTIAAQLFTSIKYYKYKYKYEFDKLGPVLRDKYGQSLRGRGMVVAEMAWPSPWIILVGSFTSCFGAALQCLCSAPRLLYSITKDDVLPFLQLFRVLNRWNEPFRCTILTAILAELVILVAAIDRIAPIVDFFFLMCYAFVNLICFLHSILGAPNWRPRFKYYHWSLSLLGALICLFIMFSTHWIYATIVLLLCAAIYKYVDWKGDKKEWGDGIRGLVLSTAQFSLSKLEDKIPHPKNWRPQLLLITNLPSCHESNQEETTRKLLHLASQLKKGRGLTIAVSLRGGDPTDSDEKASIAAMMKTKLAFEMTVAKVRGFCSSLIYDTDQVEAALSTLIQSSGIGPLHPNTLLVPYPELGGVGSNYWSFLHRLQRGAAEDMSLLIPKGILLFPELEDRISGLIDVWWILHDGGLLLLISFLLKQHKVWRSCKMRIFVVVQHSDNQFKMRMEMEEFLYQMRIDAELILAEFDSPDISAYEVQRSIDVNREFARRQTRVSLAQLILDQHRGSRDFLDEKPLKNPKDITQFNENNDKSGIQFNQNNDTSGIQEDYLDHPMQHVETPKSPENNRREVERTFTFTPSMAVHDHIPKKKEKKSSIHSAVRLNAKIVEKSQRSALIVLNLPEPPKTQTSFENYMRYLDVLTHSLKRVLLVRGTGNEVITMYS